MGSIAKPLKVAPLISGTIPDTETVTVSLPIGVEYFKLTAAFGGGDLLWAWKAADLASGAHAVAAGESTDNIIATPLTLALKASGGNVDYSIFVVLEGK
jgi:hypothetical protein